MRVRNNYSDFGAFAGTWEDWCDKTYPETDPQREKCKKCPVKVPIVGTCLTPAPWTIVGKAARGIGEPMTGGAAPATGGTTTNPNMPGTVTYNPNMPTTYPPPETGLDTKTMILIGGGVIGVAALAMAFSGHRGAYAPPRQLNGYNRRKPSRRRAYA